MLKISLMMLLCRHRDFKLMLSSDPVYLVELLLFLFVVSAL